MEKSYIHFVREIYTYCDNNIEDKALFPAFVGLWDDNEHKSKKDLAVMTSKIISRLLWKKIIIETAQKSGAENGYGLYRILPHENLVEHNDMSERRMRLLM